MPTSYNRLVQQYMKQGMSQATAEEKATQRYAQQNHGQKPAEQPRRRRKNEDYSAIISNFLEDAKTATKISRSLFRKGRRQAAIVRGWEKNPETVPDTLSHKDVRFNQELVGNTFRNAASFALDAAGVPPETRVDPVEQDRLEREKEDRKSWYMRDESTMTKKLNGITEGFLTWLTGLASKGTPYGASETPPTPPKQTVKAAKAEKTQSTREQGAMQHAGVTNIASLGYQESPAFYRKIAGTGKLNKETRTSAENLGVLPSTRFKSKLAPTRPFKDAPKGGHWSSLTGLRVAPGHNETLSPGQSTAARGMIDRRDVVQAKHDFAKTYTANRTARYNRAYNAVESLMNAIENFLAEERAPGIAKDPATRAKILTFMRAKIIGQKATEIPHHKETAPGASYDANISSGDNFEFKPGTAARSLSGKTDKSLELHPEGPEWNPASSYREPRATNFVDASGKDVPKATVVGGLTPERPPERTGVTHVSGRMFTKDAETRMFAKYANQARDIANLPATVEKRKNEFLTGLASKRGKKTITYPAKNKKGDLENKTTTVDFSYVNPQAKQNVDTPPPPAESSFQRQLATHLAKAAMLRRNPETHISDIQKMAAKFGSTKPK